MRVKSPCFDTSLHLRATTSEKRSPVKHEKKNIRSTSLLSHGVAASKRSSSNVRNWRSCADSSMRNVRIRLSVSAGTSPSRTAQAIKCRNLAKVFSSSYGGGLYNRGGTVEVGGTAVICNNYADKAGDDIVSKTDIYTYYINEDWDTESETCVPSLTLSPVGEWTLDKCKHPIVGWYHDGKGKAGGRYLQALERRW